MRVALVGYGKMGREIELVLNEMGHEISFRITSKNAADIQKINTANTDVAIEFSTPNTVLGNIKSLLNNRVSVVVGTTGWYEHLSEVEQLVTTNEVSLLYASNFSLGVNLFFQVNKALAELMNDYDDYDVSMMEAHHTQKLDSPSETAITIAEQVLQRIERKTEWKETVSPAKNTLGINALRQPEVKGTHLVRYDSDIDSIEIKHIAKNRKGFAKGSVLAAQFIFGKSGVFTMKDVLFKKS